MNTKYGLILSTCLLAASIGNANAAVIQDQCTNLDDGYGGYYGVSCTYEYSFNLVGTVGLQAVGSDVPPASFDIFGTLTQKSWYEENYSGGSSAGETTTVLNLNLGDVLLPDYASTVQYTMTRVDTLLDFATQIGPVTESLANTPYAISSPSSWFIETDGINLLLDLNGAINLTGAGLTELSATVQVSAMPVPAAVWLFASGLLGLVGLAKRKQL